jgi:hypothetical protein
MEEYLYDSTSSSDEIIIEDENDSETIEIDESDYDDSYSDESDYYSEIHDEEEEFIDSEKQNNQYIIGTSKYYSNYGFIYMSGISSKSFFQFSFKNVHNYLKSCSLVYLMDDTVDIIKINIIDNVYCAIKKTYWLRLIQRNWKRVCKERNKILNNRKKINSLRHFTLRGKWPLGMNNLPGLYGLLSIYNTKNYLSKVNKYKN